MRSARSAPPCSGASRRCNQPGDTLTVWKLDRLGRGLRSLPGLRPRTNHETGDSRQACVVYLPETRLAEPAGILRLAVAAAAARAHQHVERKQGGEAGSRLVGFQDEVL